MARISRLDYGRYCNLDLEIRRHESAICAVPRKIENCNLCSRSSNRCKRCAHRLLMVIEFAEACWPLITTNYKLKPLVTVRAGQMKWEHYFWLFSNPDHPVRCCQPDEGKQFLVFSFWWKTTASSKISPGASRRFTVMSQSFSLRSLSTKSLFLRVVGLAFLFH